MRSGNSGEIKDERLNLIGQKANGEIYIKIILEKIGGKLFPFDKRLKNEQINNLNLQLNVFVLSESRSNGVEYSWTRTICNLEVTETKRNLSGTNRSS